MAKKPLPVVLADEHILEPVVQSVRDRGWFKVLRANHDRRFRGRNEWDYISELRSQHIVFLTQDAEFVKHVLADGVRHAGIVWLPTGWNLAGLTFALAFVCGLLKARLDDGVHGAHDVIFKVEDDGIRGLVKGQQVMFWSIDQMKLDIEEHLGESIDWDE